jgi:Tol biopolymer transport system component
VAVTIASAKNNVWVYDLERETATPVTAGRYNQPLWTADERLVMSKGPLAQRDLVERDIDIESTERTLLKGSGAIFAADWTADRRLVVERGDDIFILGEDAPELKAIVATPASEIRPRVSPDGRWLAYVSDDTGRYQGYVRDLDNRVPRQRVSTNGALAMAWAPDGRTLYFTTSSERSMWSAAVTTSPSLAVGRPQRLFADENYSPIFDVTPDGRRFVMMALGPLPPNDRLELVQNALTGVDRAP